MRSILVKLHDLSNRESGQTMAEYAVVLAVVSIGILAALGALAVGIAGGLDQVTSAL